MCSLVIEHLLGFRRRNKSYVEQPRGAGGSESPGGRLFLGTSSALSWRSRAGWPATLFPANLPTRGKEPSMRLKILAPAPHRHYEHTGRSCALEEWP